MEPIAVEPVAVAHAASDPIDHTHAVRPALARRAHHCLIGALDAAHLARSVVKARGASAHADACLARPLARANAHAAQRRIEVRRLPAQIGLRQGVDVEPGCNRQANQQGRDQRSDDPGAGNDFSAHAPPSVTASAPRNEQYRTAGLRGQMRIRVRFVLWRDALSVDTPTDRICEWMTTDSARGRY